VASHRHLWNAVQTAASVYYKLRYNNALAAVQNKVIYHFAWAVHRRRKCHNLYMALAADHSECNINLYTTLRGRFKGTASAIIRTWHLLHITASAISTYNALTAVQYQVIMHCGQCIIMHWLWFAQYRKCRWPKPLRHLTD